ncbi:MAG: NTP transferase domain-containing protein [Synergistaceae bacterium]|nr:NTP transferase domain-containing protein [Synergistaceae bacterium]
MVAALIIAAGKTDRRNSFEPQKEIGTIPNILRIVKIFQRAGIDRIVIVCEEDEDKVMKFAARMNVVFLRNRHDADMFENVKIGLSYLLDKCVAAIITHVDVPLFSVDTVYRLMAAEGPACIPSYDGNTGHPMLLRSEHFQKVLSYRGEGGLSGAVNASGLQSRIINVDDEGILVNVNYKDDYDRLVAEHSLMELRPEVCVSLVKEKAFFDPRAHQLLRLTDETASLREACKQMGISYSQGRSIISIIEQQLGFSIIESRQGGKSGGYSLVTNEGKELMRKYTEFCADARQYMNKIFGEYFT